MALRQLNAPALPVPSRGEGRWASEMVRTLSFFLKAATYRLNLTPTAVNYVVADLPSASESGAGSIIYVSDETGGSVLAFSDGTDWRRSTDRAVVA